MKRWLLALAVVARAGRAQDPALKFATSEEDFPNPERGFTCDVDLFSEANLKAIKKYCRNSLVRSYLYLQEFKTKALSADYLAKLEAGFARARREGVKVIPIFAYTSPGWDPKTSQYGCPPPLRADCLKDATKEVMLGHIQQLAPLLARNSDVIAVMPAGFIGFWGEWHHSADERLNFDQAKQSNAKEDAGRHEILGALLKALPSERMLQIRYPYEKPVLFGPTGNARVGFENLCFLSDNIDLGTYVPTAIESGKKYLGQETERVVMGGESCIFNPPRSDCPTALRELESMHYSYLNDQYETKILNSWKTQGCYAQIRKRLGYRFALKEVHLPTRVNPGESLHVSASLLNSGFATPYNPRPVYLVIDNAKHRYEIPLPNWDPRQWAPGHDPRLLTASPKIPRDIIPGNYRVSIWMPDGCAHLPVASCAALMRNPDYSVRLANAGTWDASSGLNVLTKNFVVSDASERSPVGHN